MSDGEKIINIYIYIYMAFDVTLTWLTVMKKKKKNFTIMSKLNKSYDIEGLFGICLFC